MKAGRVNHSKWIPMEAIKPNFVERIKKELEISNTQYFAKVSRGMDPDNMLRSFTLWRERMGYMVVPREYNPPPVVWEKEPQYEVEDYSGFLMEGFPKDTITLKDYQEPAFREYLKQRRGVIQLACGKGKTVIALKIAAELKVPTLIVVNTNQLMRQWKREILEETSQHPKFFPDLDEGRVGHIQQDICHYEDCPFTLAMLHTLAARKYSPEFYRYFGLIIYDEVHNLATEHFNPTADKFWGLRLGLSASPKREDGLDVVFRSHIGNVIYTDLTQPLLPDVYFIRTRLKLLDFVESEKKAYIWKKRYDGWELTDKLNWGKVYTHIGRSKKFNDIIQYYLERAANKSRKVLVLGERIEQLEYLQQVMGVKRPDLTSGLVIGKLSQAERDLSLDRQLVFATAKLAEEGLDKPEFDTLFILYPKATMKSIQQAAGRILRKHEGKENPVVLLFQQEIPEIEQTCNRARKNLDELGYPYQSVDWKGVEGGTKGENHAASP